MNPEELLENFQEHLKVLGRAPGAIYGTSHRLSYFFKWLKREDIGLSELSPAVIRKFTGYLQIEYVTKKGTPFSVASIQGILSCLRCFLRYLARAGYLLCDLSREVMAPRGKSALPRDILSYREVKSLLAGPELDEPLGLRNRSILELFYSSGVRRRELINLDLYDVDLDKMNLCVRQGKGGKDRMLPLGRWAAYYLKEYLEKSRPLLFDAPSEKALFLGRSGQRLTPGRVGMIVRECARGLAPGKHLTCHALRHTFATHLLEAGAEIRAIQELLGHVELRSTQIYTRISPQELKKVHKKCHPRG